MSEDNKVAATDAATDAATAAATDTTGAATDSAAAAAAEAAAKKVKTPLVDVNAAGVAVYKDGAHPRANRK